MSGMVVLPHGGPEARDYFGFNRFAQFLAAQGYVVVQPNFRGSAGFGGGCITAPQCLQVRCSRLEKKRSNTGGNCVSMLVSSKYSL